MKEQNENNQFGKESAKFGLPEDYFQKSANSIRNKIEWQEEHKDFPKLNALKGENIFSLPLNYFSSKEKELELLDYPTLSSIEQKQPFIIPDNYFDELANVQRLKLSEDLQKEDLVNLNSIKKQNNFRVPINYFLEKEASLKRNIQESSKAKIIPLFSKRIAYSAAALVLLVLGIWLYNIYFLSVQPADCGTIACLDKQDLVKTKNLESLEDDQLYELVDPAALEKKLSSSQGKVPLKENSNTNLNEDSLNEFPDDI